MASKLLEATCLNIIFEFEVDALWANLRARQQEIANWVSRSLAKELQLRSENKSSTRTVDYGGGVVG
ncbi:hypothetical protein QR680_007722 [Steinernema hermaphroditum]|uniref:Uncharacterized protein n=1 Tax=Steinernema hermaphroditum TaxID=289476 RepID=A0AA39M6V1_9BILA|nr:hypothetical protein QR680_007722 [Steinernema hermaphroditum]